MSWIYEDDQPQKRRKYRYEEDKLQIATAQYIAMKHRNLLAWHTPNEGLKNIVTGRRLKRMGVVAGVPDWTIVHRGRVCFIELKTATGGQSPEQALFERVAVQSCAEYHICRSVDEFIETLETFLGGVT